MFMEARDEETGDAMSEQQLRDEVMTMVSAGHETTANALTWTFYLLSENPAVAEKLRAELRRVLPGGRTPAIDDLPELSYTEAVIKESMRLLPPVWLIARSATEDDRILGEAIPKGAMVFLPVYVLHRDRRFWERPLEMTPERWLSPEIDSLPKYAYFPFAGGPRVCIGNAFAMMEAKLLLAMIAGRWAPRMVPGHKVRPVPTVTLRPKHGLKTILESAL
jgi:cytochrome P450